MGSRGGRRGLISRRALSIWQSHGWHEPRGGILLEQKLLPPGHFKRSNVSTDIIQEGVTCHSYGQRSGGGEP